MFAKPILTAGTSAAISIAAIATASAAGLNGVNVVTTNTYAGPLSKGVEVDVGNFGLPNSQFAKVGSGVEQPAFIALYDIDFSDNTIRFKWVETPFSKKAAGPVAKGQFDRNYFTFDLPKGLAVTKIEFDEAGSKLLKGSAKPTAKIVAPRRVLVTFGPGVIRNIGFSPQFKLTVAKPKKK